MNFKIVLVLCSLFGFSLCFVDRSDFSFSGQVVINLRVLESSSTITLHQRQLNILSTQLDSVGREVQLKPFCYDKTHEFLSISTDYILQKDATYNLTIQYKGILRDDLMGFYKSYYIDSHLRKRWLATTQFEASDARHAFPCYDEPALKATFSIQIVHGANYRTISNMPQKIRKESSDVAITSFETTPLMSTYLVAFVVSDFQYLEKRVNNESTSLYRVFTHSGEIDKAPYVLDEGYKLLHAISDYLQVPYTLPKIDHVMIPQFRSGAMENWGLVTYNERSYFKYVDLNDIKHQMPVSRVISHGHQWFGNLVSPKWWSYIWLNEGLATLFEVIGVEIVHPEWNATKRFVHDKLHMILERDVDNELRPMTFYVKSPEKVRGLFSDDVAYSKSASVIRMFLHAFTKDSFRNGLKYYLTKQSYGVADENDLFKSLERAAKEENVIDNEFSVKDMFGSWSNQRGFPLLRVTRDYTNGTITIQQEKYVKREQFRKNDQTWWIPYNFASKNNHSFHLTAPHGWLPHGTRSKLIEQNESQKWSNDDWLVFNLQQTGYYRVLYDEENYKLLANELKFGDIDRIHPINRFQILDDLRNFVKVGLVRDEIFQDLLKYSGSETDPEISTFVRNYVSDRYFFSI